MFIFATSLVGAEEAAGGPDWINLGAGLIGALATLIAAVITVRLQDSRQEKRRRGKIKSNDLPFKGIIEKNSFSALDALKVLDLRDSPSLKADVEGTAVLTDSHLIVREGDAGNGVVFCYATSGSISGASDRNAYEWGEIGAHSSLKRGIAAKSFVSLAGELAKYLNGQWWYKFHTGNTPINGYQRVMALFQSAWLIVRFQ